MRYEIGFGTGFTGSGEPINATDRGEWIKLILVEASQRFGGCNITFGQGAWIDPSGNLIVEESAVVVVQSLPVGRLATDWEAEARSLGEFIRSLFQQSAVVFTQIVSTTALLGEVSHDVVPR